MNGLVRGGAVGSGGEGDGEAGLKRYEHEEHKKRIPALSGLQQRCAPSLYGGANRNSKAVVMDVQRYRPDRQHLSGRIPGLDLETLARHSAISSANAAGSGIPEPNSRHRTSI